MAEMSKFLPFLRRWEGGFSDHPDDRGGATFRGVTLTTLREFKSDATVVDLKELSEADWREIVYRKAWKPCGCDEIQSQAVAEMLADWMWMSGRRAIVALQALLRVRTDGIVGRETLAALNGADAEALWLRIKESRRRFYYRLVQRNPRQRVFLNGWLRRLEAMDFD